MKDIRTVLPIEQNDKGTQVVSGRDLHNFLEITTRFNMWINRMIDYGFKENIDYVVLHKKVQNLSGGRPSEDVAMTLDMAKEIAMIQRTEKGKQARQYFINAEEELKAIKQDEFKLPSTPREITKVLLANMDENNEDIKAIKTDVKDLKDNQRIDSGEYSYLQKQVSKRVYVYAKFHGINANQETDKIRKLFKDLGDQIKDVSGVRTRSQIKAKDYENVMRLVDDWEPTTATRMAVGQQSLDFDDKGDDESWKNN